MAVDRSFPARCHNAFAIFPRPAVAYNMRGGFFNGSAWYTGAGIHFHSGLPAVRSGDDAAESRRQEVTKLFSGDNLSNRGSPENYPFRDCNPRTSLAYG